MHTALRILCIIVSTIALSGAGTSVYHIGKIEFQTIDKWYAHYVETHYKKARAQNAALVILELDTPGGLVSDALKIRSIIMDSPVPTAVFINKNAISAGALISLSAKYIFISEGGVLGAATPVIRTPSRLVKASEKEVSVMRAEMRSTAQRFQRNPRIAEAMVDDSMTLTEKDDGIALEKGKLLTLTADEALSTGMVNGKASSVSDIAERAGVKDARITKAVVTFRDRLLGFLTNPIVLMLLLAIGIFAAFIEFKTAGLGIGGSVAALSFAMFFISQFLLGDANWIAPALFLVGAILIVVEIFLIPGFGIPGVIGFLLMIAGIIISFGVNRIETAVIVVFFALVIATIGIVLIARRLPKSPLFRKLSLNEEQHGYRSSDSFDTLLGRQALVAATLRPAGQVEIDGKRYDAVSEGSFIEKGLQVKVIKVEGNRIVVGPVSAG
ncbi:MAG: nodulation protein NfeD [Spirochaetes bacterium]|nr:nodulation protein NfeD [Spirochaetota bacterium]